MSFLDRFRPTPAPIEKRSNPYSDENISKTRASIRRSSRRVKRSYEMAEDDRLASRWKTTTTSADGSVRYALAPLRARARELEENDPYITRYFQLLEGNVVGETGIVPVPEPPSVRNAKQIDEFAAKRIAAAFKLWSKRGNVTVCGQYSLADLEKRILRSTAVDGEIFLRLVTGPQAGNEFDFAIEVLEADLLDETYSTELPSGNVVRMGVERNRSRRPVAYHFLNETPGEYIFGSNRRRDVKRRRIPAAEVIHCAAFSRMRPGQTRAVSWFAPVGPSLYQLHAYRKAEAVAARVGSEKMGFYQGPAGEDFGGDHSGVNSDEFVQESDAGTFEVLPDGWTVETFDPDHPSTAFDAFNKALTRTASAGLGVGYNELANDLESVSYSSMRSGTLENRAHYRTLQRWLIETCGLADRIYPAWLESSLLAGAIKLAVTDVARLRVHRWQSRGFPWVDPMKEGQGNKLSLESGTKLFADVVSETSGRTLDEQLDALRIEREKFASLGLTHPTDAAAQANQPEPEPDPEEDPKKPGSEDDDE